MKFLIVDDDEMARTYLERVLVSQGHDVVTASNGLDALAITHESPPDVVVSDIMMPEMDGFALCRRIRQDPRLARMPFVFYSATYTEPRDEEFARAIGVSRILVKPLAPLEFLQAMNETSASIRQVPEASSAISASLASNTSPS